MGKPINPILENTVITRYTPYWDFSALKAMGRTAAASIRHRNIVVAMRTVTASSSGWIRLPPDTLERIIAGLAMFTTIQDIFLQVSSSRIFFCSAKNPASITKKRTIICCKISIILDTPPSCSYYFRFRVSSIPNARSS